MSTRLRDLLMDGLQGLRYEPIDIVVDGTPVQRPTTPWSRR